MERLLLHQDEKVIEHYHQSFFVLMPSVILCLVVILLPWYYLAKYSLASVFPRLVLLWVLVVGIYLLRKLIVWWLNLYIITDQRLARISHEGLFKKLVVETPLERILNVSFKTTGFWSSLLKYGDVEVQVVGLMEPIILKHIAEPAEIKDQLWELHQKKSKESHSFEAGQIDHVQESLGYTKQNQKIL